MPALRDVYDLLRLRDDTDAQATCVFPDGLANQFGSVFGGAVAAAAVAAIEARMPPDSAMRAVHVRFLSPARPDVPLTVAIETQEVKGRPVLNAHIGAEQPVASASVMLGPVVAAAGPTDATTLPAAPGWERSPSFLTSTFDFRAAIDDDPDLLWVAVRALSSDPGEPLPVAALALMADLAGVGPFRVAGRRKRRVGIVAHDLVLHVVQSTLGQWVRVHLETPVLAERSAIGRLSLAAGDGSVLAIAQQACSVRQLPD